MTVSASFATSWIGLGDGFSWSDPANWSNGLPLTGATAPATSPFCPGPKKLG